jgi:hypothetical protein
MNTIRDRLLFEAEEPKEYRANVLKKRNNAALKSSIGGTKIEYSYYIAPGERNGDTEKTVKKKIKKWIEFHGGWVHMANPNSIVNGKSVPSQPGVPDMLAFVFDKFIAIECKASTDNAKISNHQIRELAALQRIGAHSLVAHSTNCIEKYMQETDKLSKNPPLRQEHQAHLWTKKNRAQG